MNIEDQFKGCFSKENLKWVFDNVVSMSSAVGIDGINLEHFRARLEEEVAIIERKCLAGTYRFTKYKLKLLSKGRGKSPREISIPTVRDRVALRALCKFLQERFKESLSGNLPQKLVHAAKSDMQSKRYSWYIKLDVKSYYPSIQHDEMMKRLGEQIHSGHAAILGMLERAMKTPTVTVSRANDSLNSRGVPQGLSISNVLADIYLANIDRHYKNLPNVAYYRYVDDILILCDGNHAAQIKDDVIRRFGAIGLGVHEPEQNSGKSSWGAVTSPFGYLGYTFHKDLVSVRDASVEKIRSSIAAMFARHKYAKKPSKQFLEWRLNLRITGCVFENASKGWLVYFSEITDESLLHNLDWYVQSLAKRFRVNVNVKRFVRAYYELTRNRKETRYVPNFDEYSPEQKRQVLTECFGLHLGNKSPEEIEWLFKKKLSRQVKDLLEDIGSFS